MEMSVAALEAYVVPQCHVNKSGKFLEAEELELETYGLLWGHEVFLPDGDILYSIQKLTIDTMAHRRTDFVHPSNGLNVIKDMITSYWSKYSFLGDFHSHPYEHFAEVEQIQGYEFSEADRKAMLNQKQRDDDFRVSVVMTIASLKRSSEIEPRGLASNIICWTFNNYRFWLNACVVYKDYTTDNEVKTKKISILPNSPHWKTTYKPEKYNDIEEVYLHCSYLQPPWQVTRFGKKAGKGDHLQGDV
jgi:hypothetical protein